MGVQLLIYQGGCSGLRIFLAGKEKGGGKAGLEQRVSVAARRPLGGQSIPR